MQAWHFDIRGKRKDCQIFPMLFRCTLGWLCLLCLLPRSNCDGSLALSDKMLSPIGRLFITKDGHVPSYKTTNPSPTSTVHSLTWPVCYGKHSAILGSFCVPATTEEEEKLPKTRLPRLSVNMETVGSSLTTIFMFDDEDDAWATFRKDAYENKSCAAISEYANVVVHPEGAKKLSASRSLKGKAAHTWYVVAVDCEQRQCPNVSSVNITYFHPSTDGSRSACTAELTSFSVLKGAMVEGWQALSIRNVLNISGVNTFGVVLLYFTFLLLAALSAFYLRKGLVEKEAAKKELQHAAWYLSSIAALCYLTMATGNGLLVLRRLSGRGAGWAYSKSLMATEGDPQNPNPFYDPKYAASPTYPFFFVRELGWVAGAGLMLHYLSWIVGLPAASKQLLLFAGVGRALCNLAATAIMGGSRWVFWLLEVLFLALVLVELNAMKPLAMRRGKLVTTTYQRLRKILLASWFSATMLWLPCAGTKAMSSDLDVALYALLDLLTVLSFTSMLVGGGHADAPALRNVESQRLTTEAADREAGGADHDDLGDLEDNL